MATATEVKQRGSLTHPDVDRYDQVNRDVLRILEKPGLGWWVLFGIATAGGLIALGMLPRQVLLSVLGSVGLLVNVPWAIGHFFPGEGRAPLLIMVTGGLIIAIAVLLTRSSGRLRHAERLLARAVDRRDDDERARLPREVAIPRGAPPDARLAGHAS